ncbi:ectonucleoside triphosphate diphosphohydrolase 6 isoform X5 [Sphaerodactylus townsendi]|uniref:ectonucleoside triphosphate diphosphohydrolase 6 isoform X5 n=1 Tax=Sphaerodactylus townsendi TaxID=933632 RepID=UPI0020268EAD|nr:ectonucleoside triphosphate diphosphohydrolase 6 isoform X5 [Sphaerodactylus townsendi]
MKIPKLYYAFGIFGSAIIIVAYVKWNGLQPILETTERATVALEKQLHSEQSRIGQEVLYGIMFDAGSTGTRIHVFKFTQNPKETPKVIDETFRGLRPGLSAYADNVDESAQGINELLAVAKEVIPMELWKSTPLVLKATAGLRLLPGEKAQQLLDKVKEIFHASPFLVNDDCISIMEGTDEGISAWVTVNFLTGRFTDPTKGTVGILDLGGGSTQITFHLSSEAASGQSSASDIISFKMFNHVYQLYSHSYLGLGLRMARLAVLGAIQGQAYKEEGGTLTVSDFETAANNACGNMEAHQEQHPFLCMDLTYISLLLQKLGFPKSHNLKLVRKINNIEIGWALGATLRYMDSLSKLQY